MAACFRLATFTAKHRGSEDAAGPPSMTRLQRSALLANGPVVEVYQGNSPISTVIATALSARQHLI